MRQERGYWAVKCPYCNKWQCKEQFNYGKEVERCTCIYCGEKILLQNAGRLLNLKAAQSLVMRKNAEGQETKLAKWITYKRKDNDTSKTD